MRYKMTKREAEHWIQIIETTKIDGFSVQGFYLGDGKYYSKKLLYDIRDNDGLVMQIEPLTAQDHIAVVPNNGSYYPPKTSYIDMVKSTVCKMRNKLCQQ